MKRVHVLLPLITVLSACAATTQPATQPATIKVDIAGKTFTLEVADNDELRQKGLMNRQSMPADHGMIFVFDTPDKHGFWMRNTFIPLDLVYLDTTGVIVDIQPLKPHNEDVIMPVKPAAFAIEFNAGTAKDLKLDRGQTIKLPDNLLKKHARTDDK